MDSNGHSADILGPAQAAERLGVSERTVRRMIARGEIEGTRDPYSTTVRAVDALRRRQAGQGALYSPPLPERVDGLDRGAGVVDSDEGTAVMVAIAAELQGARDQIERLARENGRLASQLEQIQMQGPPRLRRPRSRAVRLVRWLRGGGHP